MRQPQQPNQKRRCNPTNRANRVTKWKRQGSLLEIVRSTLSSRKRTTLKLRGLYWIVWFERIALNERGEEEIGRAASFSKRISATTTTTRGVERHALRGREIRKKNHHSRLVEEVLTTKEKPTQRTLLSGLKKRLHGLLEDCPGVLRFTDPASFSLDQRFRAGVPSTAANACVIRHGQHSRQVQQADWSEKNGISTQKATSLRRLSQETRQRHASTQPRSAICNTPSVPIHRLTNPAHSSTLKGDEAALHLRHHGLSPVQQLLLLFGLSVWVRVL